MDNEIYTIEDVIAATYCAKGFTEGYEGPHPIPNIEIGADILNGWPHHCDNDVKKVCHDFMETMRWLKQTDLIFQDFTKAYPGTCEQKSDFFFGRDDGVLVGRSVIEPTLGEPATLEIELPFLRKTKEVFEVVYVDTRRQPMTLHERSDFLLMAGLNEALFYHMTGKNLLTRLLAPGYRKEEILNPTTVNPQEVLTRINTSPLFGVTYGKHCQMTKNEYNPTGKTDWRCPIREQCDPFDNEVVHDHNS